MQTLAHHVQERSSKLLTSDEVLQVHCSSQRRESPWQIASSDLAQRAGRYAAEIRLRGVIPYGFANHCFSRKPAKSMKAGSGCFFTLIINSAGRISCAHVTDLKHGSGALLPQRKPS